MGKRNLKTAQTPKNTPTPTAVAVALKVDAETKSVATKTPKKTTVSRSLHGVEMRHDGPSKGFNKRKSKTKIDHSIFGDDESIVFTQRSDDILNPLRAKYKTGAFPRADMDAWVLKRAIQKGVVKPVTGDGTKESDTYQFVS